MLSHEIIRPKDIIPLFPYTGPVVDDGKAVPGRCRKPLGLEPASPLTSRWSLRQ